ncbi:Leucine-rich repeat-containing protein ODA7 [Diplonema papillatum]|nr:Leucine-rich repeat-containing protein ODA7 [Diplonema papillatum]
MPSRPSQPPAANLKELQDALVGLWHAVYNQCSKGNIRMIPELVAKLQQCTMLTAKGTVRMSWGNVCHRRPLPFILKALIDASPAAPISELDLSDNQAGDEHVKLLVTYVANSKHLQHLDLSGSSFSPAGIEAIRKVARDKSVYIIGLTAPAKLGTFADSNRGGRPRQQQQQQQKGHRQQHEQAPSTQTSLHASPQRLLTSKDVNGVPRYATAGKNSERTVGSFDRLPHGLSPIGKASAGAASDGSFTAASEKSDTHNEEPLSTEAVDSLQRQVDRRVKDLGLHHAGQLEPARDALLRELRLEKPAAPRTSAHHNNSNHNKDSPAPTPTSASAKQAAPPGPPARSDSHRHSYTSTPPADALPAPDGPNVRENNDDAKWAPPLAVVVPREAGFAAFRYSGDASQDAPVFQQRGADDSGGRPATAGGGYHQNYGGIPAVSGQQGDGGVWGRADDPSPRRGAERHPAAEEQRSHWQSVNPDASCSTAAGPDSYTRLSLRLRMRDASPERAHSAAAASALVPHTSSPYRGDSPVRNAHAVSAKSHVSAVRSASASHPDNVAAPVDPEDVFDIAQAAPPEAIVRDLSKMRLATVEYTDLSKISVLILRDNDLESLCNLPPTLTRLDVSGNRLAVLDGLASCPQLEVLNVRRNRLSSAGAGLAGSRKMKILLLGWNRIRKVEGLEHLVDLAFLDLSHNELASPASLRTLSLNTSLRKLALRGNPIAHPSGRRRLCATYFPEGTSPTEIEAIFAPFGSVDSVAIAAKTKPKPAAAGGGGGGGGQLAAAFVTFSSAENRAKRCAASLAAALSQSLRDPQPHHLPFESISAESCKRGKLTLHAVAPDLGKDALQHLIAGHGAPDAVDVAPARWCFREKTGAWALFDAEHSPKLDGACARGGACKVAEFVVRFPRPRGDPGQAEGSAGSFLAGLDGAPVPTAERQLSATLCEVKKLCEATVTFGSGVHAAERARRSLSGVALRPELPPLKVRSMPDCQPLVLNLLPNLAELDGKPLKNLGLGGSGVPKAASQLGNRSGVTDNDDGSLYTMLAELSGVSTVGSSALDVSTQAALQNLSGRGADRRLQFGGAAYAVPGKASHTLRKIEEAEKSRQEKDRKLRAFGLQPSQQGRIVTDVADRKITRRRSASLPVRSAGLPGSAKRSFSSVSGDADAGKPARNAGKAGTKPGGRLGDKQPAAGLAAKKAARRPLSTGAKPRQADRAAPAGGEADESRDPHDAELAGIPADSECSSSVNNYAHVNSRTVERGKPTNDDNNDNGTNNTIESRRGSAGSDVPSFYHPGAVHGMSFGSVDDSLVVAPADGSRPYTVGRGDAGGQPPSSGYRARPVQPTPVLHASFGRSHSTPAAAAARRYPSSFGGGSRTPPGCGGSHAEQGELRSALRRISSVASHYERKGVSFYDGETPRESELSDFLHGPHLFSLEADLETAASEQAGIERDTTAKTSTPRPRPPTYPHSHSPRKASDPLEAENEGFTTSTPRRSPHVSARATPGTGKDTTPRTLRRGEPPPSPLVSDAIQSLYEQLQALHNELSSDEVSANAASPQSFLRMLSPAKGTSPRSQAPDNVEVASASGKSGGEGSPPDASVSPRSVKRGQQTAPAEVEAWLAQLNEDFTRAHLALKALVVLSTAAKEEEQQRYRQIVDSCGILRDTEVPSAVVKHFRMTEDDLARPITKQLETRYEALLAMLKQLSDTKTCLKYIFALLEQKHTDALQDYVEKVKASVLVSRDSTSFPL